MPDFTALENVYLASLALDDNKMKALDKAKNIIKKMGLINRVNHYPSELSGGEVQRISIARALINEPQIILADEPTGNLDQSTAKEVFATADMIVKVKEPQAEEIAMLREGQILYTYLHLAPDPEQTKGLVESGSICIAYETVTSPRGGLPLLAPMSKVAGRMAVQAGAHFLEHPNGGMGALLGGVPGVDQPGIRGTVGGNPSSPSGSGECT